MTITLDAVPIDATVDQLGTFPTVGTAPPIDATVQMGSNDYIVDAPPIDTTAGPRQAGSYRVRLWQLSPDDQATVPVTSPVFVISLTLEGLDAGATVVSTTLTVIALSGGAVTYAGQDINAVPGENIISIPVGATLAPGDYWWTVTVFINQNDSWTIGPHAFTVDPTAGNAGIPVAWSVDGTVDTGPYLWLLTPAGAQPGDTLAVIGSGFPTTATHIRLGNEYMPIQSWVTAVAATPNAATTDRTIGPDLVDCEHDEVTVTVPSDADLGGVVTVDDGLGHH
jgi:hypothetical protein